MDSGQARIVESSLVIHRDFDDLDALDIYLDRQRIIRGFKKIACCTTK